MAITLRTLTGSELTYEQVDTNFSSLIHSASIAGNTLTLHYTASAFAPSNLTLPITSASFATSSSRAVSSSYAVTSSITDAVIGSAGYVPYFETTRTLNDSSIYVDENGRVGIGTEEPNQSAILDLAAKGVGFLPPRMTTSQMEDIPNPAGGLMIYNTDEKKIAVYNGSWRLLSFA